MLLIRFPRRIRRLIEGHPVWTQEEGVLDVFRSKSSCGLIEASMNETDFLKRITANPHRLVGRERTEAVLPEAV